MEALIILAALVSLALAAWRWGVDSTDGVDSREWSRRRSWRGWAGAASRSTAGSKHAPVSSPRLQRSAASIRRSVSFVQQSLPIVGIK